MNEDTKELLNKINEVIEDFVYEDIQPEELKKGFNEMVDNYSQ